MQSYRADKLSSDFVQSTSATSWMSVDHSNDPSMKQYNLLQITIIRHFYHQPINKCKDFEMYTSTRYIIKSRKSDPFLHCKSQLVTHRLVCDQAERNSKRRADGLMTFSTLALDFNESDDVANDLNERHGLESLDGVDVFPPSAFASIPIGGCLGVSFGGPLRICFILPQLPLHPIDSQNPLQTCGFNGSCFEFNDLEHPHFCKMR